MTQITTTIQTTCPTPSIYDLSRMLRCDRTIILEQVPLIYDANVNALHLPSCTNKQIVVPIGDTSGVTTKEIPVVNLDGFFRNLRGLILTGYATAPNLDLLLDFLETWRELTPCKTTLAELNLASLTALKLIFNLPLGTIEADFELTGRKDEHFISYAERLTSYFMFDTFVYRSGHTSVNESAIVQDARQSGVAMRYQMVDQDMPGLETLPQTVDVKNTSCLEALAWLPVDKHTNFFKATLYGD